MLILPPLSLLMRKECKGTLVRTRVGKKSKKRERPSSSRAATKRRREAELDASVLFPAFALVKRRKEVENAVIGVQSALGVVENLVWDDNSIEHVGDVVAVFQASNEKQRTDKDTNFLDFFVVKPE